MPKPTSGDAYRKAQYATYASYGALFLTLFGLAAFGMAIYSTVTLNKWDNCSKSNCVSSGTTVASCIQGTCVEFDLPDFTNATAIAVNSLIANYTTVNNDLTVGGNVYLATSGGNATGLNSYEVYNFNTSLFGAFTANQSTSATIVHVGDLVFYHSYANISAACTRG
jgi:hypothetical protein